MIDAQTTQQISVVVMGAALPVILGVVVWHGWRVTMSPTESNSEMRPTLRARITTTAIATIVVVASLGLPRLVPPLIALLATTVGSIIAFAIVAAFPHARRVFRHEVRFADLTALGPTRFSDRFGEVILPFTALLVSAALCASISSPPFAWSETVGLKWASAVVVEYSPFPGWALSLPALVAAAAQLLVGRAAIRRVRRLPRLRGESAVVAAADAYVLERMIRGVSIFAIAIVLAHLLMMAGAGIQTVSMGTDTEGTPERVLQPAYVAGTILLIAGILGWAGSIVGVIRCAGTALRSGQQAIHPANP